MNNEPTAADYAWASANDANDHAKKLEARIKYLEEVATKLAGVADQLTTTLERHDLELKRLQEVVAKLATELDEHWEYTHYHIFGNTHLPQGMTRPDPIPSAEEMVEMTLYPEHFK